MSLREIYLRVEDHEEATHHVVHALSIADVWVTGGVRDQCFPEAH